ncbi:MAG: serine acetyltransferase [Clostridia bacterium]|nr:serine acetyltransferase [Clostridia bacterium]
MNSHKQIIENTLRRLDEASELRCSYFSPSVPCVPDRKEVITLIKYIHELMFPEYFRSPELSGVSRQALLERVFLLLKRQIGSAFCFLDKETAVDTEAHAYAILDRIPEVKAKLIKDVQATFEGDPAARSPEEIILCYPGFYAVSIYRIAHEFYIRNIPYISRMMTEFAHEKTGIDIHAGATIGEHFCIDHGTGVVIGETTTIGDRVKIYQGVTLGAKSFELDGDGNPVKGIKRHPDIGNDCIIYAGATILGGKTQIGDGSVIGGNVWLTHSVPAGTTVYYEGGKK